jgi:hypothetical protein
VELDAVSDPTVAPPAPTTNSPQGAITETLPIYDWNAVAGAAKYQFTVYDLTASTYVISQVSPGTGTDYWVPDVPLDRSHAYRWRVRAFNSLGEASPYSAWSNFGYLPFPPETYDPSGPETETTPTLVWSKVNGDRYQAAVWDLDTSSYVVSDVVTRAQVCPVDAFCRHPLTAPLEPTHRYRWRVRAFNATGTGPYSPWRDFCFAPAVPEPMAPVGTIADTTPTFEWGASAGALRYQVAVFDNTAGAWAISEVVTGATSFTPATPLDPTHTYQWRVRAMNGCTASSYSAYLSFAY